MRIGVDVSGGDNAPHEILKGSFDALPRLGEDDVLVLAGREATIRESMAEAGIKDSRIEILDSFRRTRHVEGTALSAAQKEKEKCSGSTRA